MLDTGLDNPLTASDTGFEDSTMESESSERLYDYVNQRETGGSQNLYWGNHSKKVTLSELRELYNADDNARLRESFGTFDNYLAYMNERQDLIDSGDYKADWWDTGVALVSEDALADPEAGMDDRAFEGQIIEEGARQGEIGYNEQADVFQALYTKYTGEDTTKYLDNGAKYEWNGSSFVMTQEAYGPHIGSIVGENVARGIITGAAGALGAAAGAALSPYISTLPGQWGNLGGKLAGAIGGGAGLGAGGAGSNSIVSSPDFNPNVIVNLTGSDYDPDNPNNVQNPDELQNPDQDDLLDRLILTTKTITGIDAPLYEDPDNPGTYYYEDGTVAVQPDPNQPPYNTFYNPDGTEYGYGKTSDYGLIPAAPPESVKDLADPSILDNSTYVIYNPQTGEWIDTTITGRDGKPTSWGGIDNDSYWVVRGADGKLYVTDGTDLEPYRGGISDDPLMNDGVEDEFRGRHPIWQHVKNGGDLPGGGEITNGGAVVVPPKDDPETETEDTTNVADTESTSPGGGNSTSDSNTGAGGDAGTNGGDATSDSDGTNQAPSSGEVVTADGTGDPVGGEGEQGGEQPAEGDPCKMADGRTGTVKNGVCVFEPSIITVNPSVWAGNDNTTGGVTDDSNAGGDNNNSAGGDNPTVTDAATPGSTNDGNVPGVITVGPSVWGTGTSGDGNTGSGNGDGDGNGDGAGDGDGGDGDGPSNANQWVDGRGGASQTRWTPLFPGTQFKPRRDFTKGMLSSRTPQTNFTLDDYTQQRMGLLSSAFKDLA